MSPFKRLPVVQRKSNIGFVGLFLFVFVIAIAPGLGLLYVLGHFIAKFW